MKKKICVIKELAVSMVKFDIPPSQSYKRIYYKDTWTSLTAPCQLVPIPYFLEIIFPLVAPESHVLYDIISKKQHTHK
jgi:hypothetical protein